MKTTNLQFARKIALLLAIAIMVACSWLATFESAANTYIDAGLKRALISFASARALNAVLSVAQGTDLSIQPGGVGVKLSLGQILHPINEVVQQFAHLMLVASIAFGVEKILISIGAHWLISLCMTAAALGWAYFYLRGTSSPTWLTRLLIVLLMTRFALPLAVIGSDAIFHEFMAADYAASQKSIEGSTEEITGLTSASTEEHGFWSRVTGARKEISARFHALKLAVEHATEKMLKLMVIFVLQTIILPILMLWGLWGVARGSFALPPALASAIDPRRPVHAPPDAKSAHPA